MGHNDMLGQLALAEKYQAKIPLFIAVSTDQAGL